MTLAFNNKRTNWRELAAPYAVPIISVFMIVFGAAYPVLTLACFAMHLVYIFFSDEKALFRLLFVLLPVAQVYKSPIIGGTSLFTILELFAVVVYMLKIRKIKKSFLALFMVWAAYVFVGSNLNYLMWIKQMMIPLIIYVFFHTEKLSFKEIIISLTVGLIASSFFALYKEQIPNLSDMIHDNRIWEAEEEVFRFSGLYSDPNYYTQVMILCAASLLMMYASHRMGVSAIVLFVILTVFGAMTASKSFILMLGAVAILFVISMFANKRYVMGTVFAGVIGILAVMILAGRIEIFNYALLRLEKGSDLTTGRTDAWARYFAYFDQNILSVFVGSGVGSLYLDGVAAHNSYIDMIYYYGFLGTGILLAICVTAVDGERVRRSIVNYVPLLCFVVLSIFLSNIIFFDFVFALILAICALQTDFSRAKLC